MAVVLRSGLMILCLLIKMSQQNLVCLVSVVLWLEGPLRGDPDVLGLI